MTLALHATDAKAARASETANSKNETYATSPDTPKENENVKGFRLLLTPELVYLMSSDKSLAGFDIGVEGMYALYDKLAIGGSLRQAFSGLSSLFFGVDVRLTYALSGALRVTDRQVEIGDTVVFERQGLSPGGISVQLLISQTFFSNASISLPYFGEGISFGYELASDDRNNLKFGVRADMLNNGSSSLRMIQGFMSFAFWL
jgi:hypothetical protein